jgi:hypothetical protein
MQLRVTEQGMSIVHNHIQDRRADAKQILALTLDNASNNNTLVEELSKTFEGFQGSLVCMRCFAHVLNLIVKAILSVQQAKGQR